MTEQEEFETARRTADESFAKALAEDWPETPGEPPQWVVDAAGRMNELSPGACIVHVMRLTKRAAQTDDKDAGKTALQRYNLALNKIPAFMEAMKKLHEAKQEHGRDNPEWFKSLATAADEGLAETAP